MTSCWLFSWYNLDVTQPLKGKNAKKTATAYRSGSDCQIALSPFLQPNCLFVHVPAGLGVRGEIEIGNSCCYKLNYCSFTYILIVPSQYAPSVTLYH